jgi:hypothetical protein
MAKSRKLEELTAELQRIRHDPTSAAGLATLSRVMSSPYGIAVAQAARLVSEFELHSRVPELVEAFDRFMVKPAQRDPGCRAKQAIADALYRLEYRDEQLFLRGIHHVQLEPVWGSQVDTAPPLRGTCALGLVRMNYPQVMVELADLLADPEIEARVGAARAIAYSENPVGVALLRLRIKVGDTPTVLGECLAALLTLSLADGLALARPLLAAGRRESDPQAAVETAEVIALVLGESQCLEAFPVLRDWWHQVTHPNLRQTGLLAIATLRQDEALQFLLQLLATAPPPEARLALEALGLYQQEAMLWAKVQTILEQRRDV